MSSECEMETPLMFSSPSLTQPFHGRTWLVRAYTLRCSEEVVMPCYEFYCEDCKKPFEVILSLAEYEKDKIKCPKCGHEHIRQEAAAFFAVTSKKKS
jgi:putative FmdB family regulatory protein